MKKQWAAPRVERYGSVAELTRAQANPPGKSGGCCDASAFELKQGGVS